MISRFSVTPLHECTIHLSKVASNKIEPDLILNNARILIDQCKPYLEKIKLEKGELDELYINLSRGLASVVMDGIIKVNNIDNSKVDKAFKIYNKSPYNNFNY